MFQTLKVFVKTENAKHIYILLETALLNPPSYVKVCFTFLLVIKTASGFFLELKFFTYVFL